jgi:hypothetical protein
MNKHMTIMIIIFITVCVAISILIGALYKQGIINTFANIKHEFYFVHISKNGGTSMEKHDKEPNFHFYNHDYSANDIESDKIYAVIRDPISRFISSFNFAKKGGFVPDSPTFKDHPIHKFDNVNDFIHALRKEDPDAIKALFATQEGTEGSDSNVVYWTQMYWLQSDKDKELVLMDFANLDSVFKKLTGKTLSKSNTTSGSKKEKLTEENIKFLKEIYNPDFKLYDLVKRSGTGILKTNTDNVKKLGHPESLISPIRLQEKYLNE